jgi:hypothetical protein
LTGPELKSGAAWLASATPEEVDEFLSGLSRERAVGAALAVRVLGAAASAAAARGLEDLGHHGRARRGQDARRGGMGARRRSRARAGLDPGRRKRVALVGETVDQVREVMVMGESGIIACSPPDRKPEWQATRSSWSGRMARWRRSFRRMSPRPAGPQFDAAWADELGKWKKGARPGTSCSSRCGWAKNPQAGGDDDAAQCRGAEGDPEEPVDGVTHAPTEANRAYLAESFLRKCRRAMAARGWGGRSWRACWSRTRRGRCGPAAMLERRGWMRCPSSAGSWWRWTRR